MSGIVKWVLLLALLIPAFLMCMSAFAAAPVNPQDSDADVVMGVGAGSAVGFLIGLLPGIILAGGILACYLGLKWLGRKAKEGFGRD